VGDELHVRAMVELASLTPDDVLVEVAYGRMRDGDTIADVAFAPLAFVGDGAFEATVALERSGSFGYTVRVTPANPLLASPAELGLIATA
jgi:glycogen phosphorylase